MILTCKLSVFMVKDNNGSLQGKMIKFGVRLRLRHTLFD